MEYIKKPRIPSSYPDSINNATYLIAFNPEKIIHYGSAAKKAMFLSSSDIDLIENIKSNKSDELAKKIKQIVHNIDNTKLCYLGDFKSGTDPYFECEIGNIKGKRVVGFNKGKVIEFVKSRPFTEQTKILQLLKQPVSIENYLKLQELMRQDQVLRWTHDELLQGYKIIRGQKIMLSDTIKEESSMTKIDTIQWIDTENRFIEISNYFKVSNSKESFDMKDYTSSLQKDIIKTYYNGNLFKMCKRMLSYSLLKQDKRTVKRIYNIIHSGLGIMYQVIADIKTILYMKENLKELPDAKIRIMIDGFKQRLGNIYEFDFKEESMDKLIDASKTDHDKLYQLYDKLYNVLIQQTQKQLKEAGLYPLPSKFYG